MCMLCLVSKKSVHCHLEYSVLPKHSDHMLQIPRASTFVL
jgi:hypothetical protein